jgi:2-amino-4-hydroxy-6-hydroxymethyldihydropteridine diphosphokinase
MSTDVFVSLGSNIEPEDNIKKAVVMLQEQAEVLAVSSAYRTPPQGYLEQDDFINLAVKLHTSFSAGAFKTQVIDHIERKLKRVRDPHNKNAPRTIDLDISLWGTETFAYGSKPWHVPDRDILKFGHVTLPLAELAPDFVHPEFGESLGDIARQFDTSGFTIVKLVF